MTKKDEKQPNDYIAGDVETYIDRYGDLVIECPAPGIDWPRLEALPHDQALMELLYMQLQSGYSVIKPEEIAALTDGLIIGRDVVRDAQGVYQDAAAVYWHRDYQTQDAIRTLKRGDPVILYKA